MGDGNHSLATAKTHWENLKQSLNEAGKMGHPARWALVELVNVHDDGLEFEPIHRVVFNIEPAVIEEYVAGDGEEIEMVANGEVRMVRIKNMESNLPVGNLQLILDKLAVEKPEIKIDYIHGEETVKKLAMGNNVGFLLPAV